mmetsp:Transcript_27238/g.37078  ORF Transcript_27238/g.37078 Transcript_27238/m.37078 type:complete len:148 (-) Transcript_27238:185-628(-)
MLQKETISADSDKTKINKSQRYAIIQKFTEYNLMSAEELEKLSAQEKERDFSNADILLMHKVNASQTSDAQKQAVFDSYLVVDHWKQKDLLSSTSKFYNHNDPEQSGKFADQYFDKLEFVHETFHGDYFAVFFNNLNPSFLGREQDL